MRSGFVPLLLRPVARAMASSCLSLQVRSQLRWVAIHYCFLFRRPAFAMMTLALVWSFKIVFTLYGYVGYKRVVGVGARPGKDSATPRFLRFGECETGTTLLASVRDINSPSWFFRLREVARKRRKGEGNTTNIKKDAY